LSGINTKDFEKFLRIRKGLSDYTVKTYLIFCKKFIREIEKDVVAKHDIEDYLAASRNKRNDLAMFQALFRDFLGMDIVGEFRIPKSNIRPKILPDLSKIRTFYDNLPDIREKAIFLLLASSGLRLGEVLSLRLSDINFEQRMVVPDVHNGSTKHSWITFYNREAETILKKYMSSNGNGKIFNISRKQIARIFKQIAEKTGVGITPQTLRSIFAREMGLKGVPDRYIDAFCGRVPASVLARHYSDFSPETLKEIYNTANIKILR
jgi:integrase/recombinase XerD